MEVNYKEIDTSKLKKDKVETKDVPGNAGRYSYAKVKYNIGDDRAPLPRSFVVRWPVGVSNFGIQVKTDDKTGRVNYQLKYVPEKMSDAADLIESMDILDQWSAKVFEENRIEMEHLDATDTASHLLRKGLNRILYRKKDTMTAQFLPLAQDNLPSIYLGLDAGMHNPDFRTKFQRVVGVDDDGNPIMADVPWKLLYDMRVTFVPHVHFYRLCSSGRGQTFQRTLKSAIVIKIEKPKRKNAHESTARELLADPEYLKEANLQFLEAEKLASERGVDPLDPSTIPSHDGEESNDEGSSGIGYVDPLAAVKAVTGTPSLSTTITPTVPKPSLEKFVSSSTPDPVSTVTAPPSKPSLDLPVLPEMPSIP